MEKKKPKSSGASSWIGFGCLACGAAVIIVGSVLTFKTFSCAQEVADKPLEVLDSARKLAESFKTGTIKTKFFSYATKVKGSSKMQVVEVKQIEVFSRKDSKAYFWDLVKLPEVEVDIRIPVTYTYYVDLNEEWNFVLEGQTVKVYVPDLKYNTPAPDISKMEIREKRSVFRLVEDDMKKQVMEGITKELEKRAGKNMDNLNIRATARESIKEFVETWFAGILKSYGVEDLERYNIEIYFKKDKPDPKKIINEIRLN